MHSTRVMRSSLQSFALSSDYVALAALRFHLDPDDHCIPITSSIMDVVSTVVLVAVIGIFI